MPAAERVKKRVARWQAIFLTELAATANVTMSAKRAGRTKDACYKARHRDPAFRAKWDEAQDQGIAALELEMRRRAMEGVEKGIYHQGERVATERQYSDTLAIFLAKAHRPEVYRDRYEVQHAGKVSHDVIVTYKLPDNGRDGES